MHPGPIVEPTGKYTPCATHDCQTTLTRSRAGRHPAAHRKTSSPSHLVRFFLFSTYIVFRSKALTETVGRFAVLFPELRYGRERTKRLWLYTSPRLFPVHRNHNLNPNLSALTLPFHCQ